MSLGPLLLVCFLAVGGVDALGADLRVGAAAVDLPCTDKMPLAGYLESRFSKEQEGRIRAVAVVLEKPGQGKLAIVACDVLWLPRLLCDAAVARVTAATGIPADHILINATHTHHAPGTAPAHAFGESPAFKAALEQAIPMAVIQANQRLNQGDAHLFFDLADEPTIGGNSRLLLPDGNIAWINPLREAMGQMKPTGPFDSQLPVLDFRSPTGKTVALIFNHSTHTIGTRAGKDLISPSFYGLAAQELEAELGGVVSFLEGASGSTHNVAQTPTAELVERLKCDIREARVRACQRPVQRLAGKRIPFRFRVRRFDDAREDTKIARYAKRYMGAGEKRVREIFAQMRNQLAPHQGEQRETWLQALVIGDIAIVGVPAEYFTALGMDIKRRSPFRYTFIAELANDWIGYLPDQEGHRLGGYQTWMGLHSYAEEGTGERMADEAVLLLNELAHADERAAAVQYRGPRSPAEEQASFRLADPELTVELVAAEPDVISPVALAWDHAGRLFVAEMAGYPDTPKMSQIRRLEDQDGDGRYERSQVFTRPLNFPSSVMPYRDGLMVIDAPDLLFYRDRDQDGRADDVQVQWTGFHPGVQQLRANSLHLGLDGWINGANGRCGYQVRVPTLQGKGWKVIEGRGHDFRIDPIHNIFEPISGESQYGLCHDDWGERFLSWNTIPIRHAMMEDWHCSKIQALSPPTVVDLRDPADSGRVYPIGPPPPQFNTEQALYYNALCGLTIYRGDALGPTYAGDAFVCESLSNLVIRRKLKPDGPTFRALRVEEGKDFLSSTDGWFHPVFLATGPDGCLYIADFYRDLVEHPDFVADVQMRQATDFRRGADHGRIWRVRRRGLQHRVEPRLNDLSSRELVQMLNHPVGWRRDTAQRLLLEQKNPRIVPDLERMVMSSGNSLARLHALWTLAGYDALRMDLLARVMSHDPEPRLRRSALRLAERYITSFPVIQQAALAMTVDSEPAVRFQLALCFAVWPDPKSVKPLVNLLGSAEDSCMAWGVLCAASRTPGAMVLAAQPSWNHVPSEAYATFLRRLGHVVSSQAREREVRDCLAQSVRSLPGASLIFLAGMAEGLEARGGFIRRLQQEQVRAISAIASRLAREGAGSLAVQEACVDLLGWLRVREARGLLTSLLEPGVDPQLATAAVRALLRFNDRETADGLFRNWSDKPQVVRQATFAAAPTSRTTLWALLTALRGGVVSAAELPAFVRTSLLSDSDQDLSKQAHELLDATERSSEDRQRVIEQYRVALRLRGDVNRGAQLFREHCAGCHAMRGVGSQVGPDLAGVGGRRNDILLVDILDPSRERAPDYEGYIVATRAGQVLTGILVSETATSVTLKREGGSEQTIARSTIEQLRPTGRSLMPDGLEQKLRPADLADLLAYLRRPDAEVVRASP